MRKKCSSDREKLLKFEAEGQEFATFLRSLEQFTQTVKGQLKFKLAKIILMISKILQILGLQPRISKVFLDH